MLHTTPYEHVMPSHAVTPTRIHMTRRHLCCTPCIPCCAPCCTPCISCIPCRLSEQDLRGLTTTASKTIAVLIGGLSNIIVHCKEPKSNAAVRMYAHLIHLIYNRTPTPLCTLRHAAAFQHFSVPLHVCFSLKCSLGFQACCMMAGVYRDTIR